MNHAVVTEHLADYLEGDLALDLRALVDAHLDGCELCSQEVREMQQTIRLLRTLPEPETPPMIAANVMRRIRAGEAEPSFFERVARALGGVLEPSFVLPASALAVAALVVVVVQEGGSLGGAFVRSMGDSDGQADSRRALATAANGSGSSLAVERDARARGAGEAEAGDLERAFGAPVAEELASMPAPSAGSLGAFDRRPTQAERALDAFADRRDEFAALDAARAAGDSESAYSSDRETHREAHQGARREDGRADARGATDMATNAGHAGTVAATAARSRGGEGGIFGDPALAQGFASAVSGPARGEPSLRSVDGRATPMAAALPVTLSRSGPGNAGVRGAASAGGEDARDLWLARALEEPAEFARYIAGHNLAEQEIWVERLAERAAARGLLGEVVTALRAAGDEKASWLAEDFAAEGAAQATAGAAGDSPSGAQTRESVD